MYIHLPLPVNHFYHIGGISDQLREMGVTASATLLDMANGCRVWVGGVVVASQRPISAKGVAFLALEDRWGLVNVVLHPEVYEASRPALRGRRTPFVVAEGKLQKQHGAISVLASKVVALKVPFR